MGSEKTVVELRIRGGIGNQLFQWCAADRLASALCAGIELEASYYNGDSYRRSEMLTSLFGDSLRDSVSGTAHSNSAILTDTQEGLDLISCLSNNVRYSTDFSRIIVDGYWQDSRIPTSEQLALIRDCLRKLAINRKEGFVGHFPDGCFPIAIHVRRHDYLHHGVCNPDYYVDAATVMQEKFKSAKFFVFGDEPNFSQYLFRDKGLSYEIISGGGEFLDLLLMSRCAAHIISNSTFSWWGARLSSAGLVVAPSPWSYMHKISGNLIPNEWSVVPESVISYFYKKRYRSEISKLINRS
jgi:hypothetical protein